MGCLLLRRIVRIRLVDVSVGVRGVWGVGAVVEAFGAAGVIGLDVVLG